jgi:hypothetical protein
VRRLLIVAVALAAAVLAPSAGAAPGVRFGLQDDGWIQHGPGTLASRLDRIDRLGVDLVRFNLRWNEVAPRRPARPNDHRDPGYHWQRPDAVLRGLRARGIGAVVTLVGTPRWANGGYAWHRAPASGSTFAAFAYAAATRYSWVREWTVWNEPNMVQWLRPTTPAVYVTRLLNPGYAAIHRANPRARVAGGVTGPRANRGGVSPVDWIRGMGKAKARLDAYAHHPYPSGPFETPSAGGCAHCKTITMATLERLLTETARAFGPKPIWLTEYGYQTDPPDDFLGVSPELQARFLGEAALRVYRAPRVEMLVQYLYRDELALDRWQSGLVDVAGVAKLAAAAFPLPLAQAVRRGGRVQLFGQIRPRDGAQRYRLQVRTGRVWQWATPVSSTDRRGYLWAWVTAPRAAEVRVWSARDGFSPPLRLR